MNKGHHCLKHLPFEQENSEPCPVALAEKLFCLQRGVGSQMDKGVSTMALTQVSSLIKGLQRLVCGVLDVLISQSEAQMNNFPPRHNTV